MSRTLDLPILSISLRPEWDGTIGAANHSAAARIVESLGQHGLVLVRPDAPFATPNHVFLQKMAAFFRLPEPIKRRYVVEQAGVKYEVGYMPPHTEHAQGDAEYGEFIARIENEADKPVPHVGSNPIARFMAPIGERASSEEFPELNLPPVTVAEVPGIDASIDELGHLLHRAGLAVSEYISVGLQQSPRLLRDMLEHPDGPHCLAPTGVNLREEFAKAHAARVASTDLIRWLERERYCLDGFHNDVNLITVHARANTPGLHTWSAHGERYDALTVPEGCLLVQSGRQLRHLTAGLIPAMYHEVTTTPGMIPYARAELEAGRDPIRVGCPFFVHVRSDVLMSPIVGDRAAYRPIKAGDFVKDMISTIYGES
jgi:isopenicillin N synthase-like dioxygenase